MKLNSLVFENIKSVIGFLIQFPCCTNYQYVVRLTDFYGNVTIKKETTYKSWSSFLFTFFKCKFKLKIMHIILWWCGKNKHHLLLCNLNHFSEIWTIIRFFFNASHKSLTFADNSIKLLHFFLWSLNYGINLHATNVANTKHSPSLVQ